MIKNKQTNFFSHDRRRRIQNNASTNETTRRLKTLKKQTSSESRRIARNPARVRVRGDFFLLRVAIKRAARGRKTVNTECAYAVFGFERFAASRACARERRLALARARSVDARATHRARVELPRRSVRPRGALGRSVADVRTFGRV